jgi:hypothetical protein
MRGGAWRTRLVLQSHAGRDVVASTAAPVCAAVRGAARPWRAGGVAVVSASHGVRWERDHDRVSPSGDLKLPCAARRRSVLTAAGAGRAARSSHPSLTSTSRPDGSERELTGAAKDQFCEARSSTGPTHLGSRRSNFGTVNGYEREAAGSTVSCARPPARRRGRDSGPSR